MRARVVRTRIVKAHIGVSSFFLALVLTVMTRAAVPAFAVNPPSAAIYNVRTEDTWIPMKDGVRLAVKLYMPEGARLGETFPAVLEYHPYRKDDGTAARDLCTPILSAAATCAPVSISAVLAPVTACPPIASTPNRNNSTHCRSFPGSRISPGPAATWG